MKDGELKHGKRILKKIVPADLYRTAQLREAQEKYDEAGTIFKELNAIEDALRNFRLAGQWEIAVQLAEGDEKADLQWLNELERLIDDRPERHSERLTDSEIKRLKDIIEKKRV